MKNQVALRLTREQRLALEQLKSEGYQVTDLLTSFRIVKIAHEALFGNVPEEIMHALRRMSKTLAGNRQTRVDLERAAGEVSAVQQRLGNLNGELESTKCELGEVREEVDGLQSTLNEVQTEAQAALARREQDLNSLQATLEESQAHRRAALSKLTEVEMQSVPVHRLKEAEAEFHRLQQELANSRTKEEALLALLQETTQQLQGYAALSEKVTSLITDRQIADSVSLAREEQIQRLETRLEEERNRYTQLVTRVLDAGDSKLYSFDSLPTQLVEALGQLLASLRHEDQSQGHSLAHERVRRINFLEQLVQGLESRRDSAYPALKQALDHGQQLVQQLAQMHRVSGENAALKAENARLRAMLATREAQLTQKEIELKHRDQQEIIRWQEISRMPEQAYIDHLLSERKKQSGQD